MDVNFHGTIPLLITQNFSLFQFWPLKKRGGVVVKGWGYKGNNSTLNFKGVSHYQITRSGKYDATNRVFCRVNILQLLVILVFSLKLFNSPIFVLFCITYWQRTASFIITTALPYLGEIILKTRRCAGCVKKFYVSTMNKNQPDVH
jgi:hypothetical protein